MQFLLAEPIKKKYNLTELALLEATAQDEIKASEWATRFQKATSPEEIKQLWDSYYIQTWGKDAEKIKALGEAFTKELLSLGFTETENPFLVFIKNHYLANEKLALDANKYAAIHNAYVNDYISNNDLLGKGDNLLLLNRKLYANQGAIIYNYFELWHRLASNEDSLQGVFQAWDFASIQKGIFFEIDGKLPDNSNLAASKAIMDEVTEWNCADTNFKDKTPRSVGQVQLFIKKITGLSGSDEAGLITADERKVINAIAGFDSDTRKELLVYLISIQINPSTIATLKTFCGNHISDTTLADAIKNDSINLHASNINTKFPSKFGSFDLSAKELKKTILPTIIKSFSDFGADIWKD